MESTINFYESNTEAFIKATINAQMKEFYDEFLENLPKNGTILDVGCGSGRDTKYFIENGYKVIAFDASKRLCDLASKYTGIEVLNSTFEEFNSNIKFDGIWSCASFLHVKKEEMLSILNKYLDLLNENGTLYASWKCGNLERIKDKKYYCDLDEDWFNSNINSIHGKILKIWITHDVRPNFSDDWLNVIMVKNPKTI